MEKYIPDVGDSVVATRKIYSSIYSNIIVGPVVDVWSNACRILNNPGTQAEGDFRLFFNDWDFSFLHRTDT